MNCQRASTTTKDKESGLQQLQITKTTNEMFLQKVSFQNRFDTS